jgi:hypothetical protein
MNHTTPPIQCRYNANMKNKYCFDMRKKEVLPSLFAKRDVY